MLLFIFVFFITSLFISLSITRIVLFFIFGVEYRTTARRGIFTALRVSHTITGSLDEFNFNFLFFLLKNARGTRIILKK